MTTTDPRVDRYIAEARPFAQPILVHLRALIHRAVPGLAETIKWGMPHFTHAGKNLAAIAGFKAHAAVIVHGEDRTGEGMGSYGKIASVADLPADGVIIARLIAARDRIDSGKPAPRRSPRAANHQAEPECDPELSAALGANPAAKACFESFAPSHCREYLEWISEAKRPETRARRIAQAIEWLQEGKPRHWKYR